MDNNTFWVEFALLHSTKVFVVSKILNTYKNKMYLHNVQLFEIIYKCARIQELWNLSCKNDKNNYNVTETFYVNYGIGF